VRAAPVQLDGATVAELETRGSVIRANFEPASERAKATLTTPSSVTRHCQKLAQAACPLSPGSKLFRYAAWLMSVITVSLALVIPALGCATTVDYIGCVESSSRSIRRTVSLPTTSRKMMAPSRGITATHLDAAPAAFAW
jgi:hypothetical protein